MSFAATFTELSLPLLPAASLLRALFLLALLASFLLFFHPLLTGIVRALLLLLRPRAASSAPSARPAGGSLGSGA